MKKETGLPKLVMHKFITIFYLPITIAFYFYVAVGNIYDIGRLTFTTMEGYINAFILMFPFVTVVLFTVSLVGLLGLTHFGRRAILFSTTFRILMMLIIIFGELTYGRTGMAALYTASCVINILVYAYYRRRELYFVVDGQSLSEAYVMQRRSTMPSPVKRTAPAPVEKSAGTEEKPQEDEKESEPSEEKDEKIDDSSEKEDNEEKEDEECVIAVSDAVTEYSSTDVLKKCRFIYTPDKSRSVNLTSAVLDILKGKTVAELTVENTSDKEYTESDWVFMKDIHYTSKTPIGKGETTVRIEISQPVDRMSIALEEVR